jgi:hypothetical protein
VNFGEFSAAAPEGAVLGMIEQQSCQAPILKIRKKNVREIMLDIAQEVIVGKRPAEDRPRKTS